MRDRAASFASIRCQWQGGHGQRRARHQEAGRTGQSPSIQCRFLPVSEFARKSMCSCVCEVFVCVCEVFVSV